MINGKSLLDYTHPINTLYLSKDPTSPAQLFGGVWEQLTADAYLKIVTANGGVVGGTSADHKIPISSMPSHTHNLPSGTSSINGSEYAINVYMNSGYWNGNTNEIIHPAGGGQAYYPYYYGIYAWIRVE